jgi:surface protein
MQTMFQNANNFNQDLSGWNVTNVGNCFQFSSGAWLWSLPKPNFTNCTE